MSDRRLDAIRDLIQEDVGNRGLRTDPADNLVTRTAGDFEAACRSIAECKNASIAILTGFYIATADPPCGETDGPLGALFLARALVPLGIPVRIVTDRFCQQAMEAGRDTAASGLLSSSSLPPAGYIVHDEQWKRYMGVLVIPTKFKRAWIERHWSFCAEHIKLTHLLAVERVGPSHADGRCYSMLGRDITEFMCPGHLLLEGAKVTTIGIGDGGNEIGMGKIPREVIARNIARGDQIACRVPTDHLIVAGVSNWGAYGLAAGVRLLRGAAHDPALFDVDRERELLEIMVERGPLVDGVTGKQTATVDGLSFERYSRILADIQSIMEQA